MQVDSLIMKKMSVPFANSKKCSIFAAVKQSNY